MEQKQENNVSLNSDTELSNARITPPLVGLNNLIKDGLEKVTDWIEAPHMKELSEVIDVLEKNSVVRNAITSELQNEMWNTACEELIGALKDNEPDYANMHMSLMTKYLKGDGEFQKFLHSERAHEALLDCVKENLKSGWVEHCKKFIPLVRSSLQIGKDINSEEVLGICLNTLVERFDSRYYKSQSAEYYDPESWANDYLNILKEFGVREESIRDMVNSPEFLDRCENRLTDLETYQGELIWHGFEDVIRFMQDHYVSTENIENVANSEAVTNVCKYVLTLCISDPEYRAEFDFGIMDDIKTYMRNEKMNEIMNSEEVRNACEGGLFGYKGSEVLDYIRKGGISEENIDKIVINALQKTFEIDLSEVNVYSDDGRVDYTKALNACEDALRRVSSDEYDVRDFFGSLEVFKELGASKEAIGTFINSVDITFAYTVELCEIIDCLGYNDGYYKLMDSLEELGLSEELLKGKSRDFINSPQGLISCRNILADHYSRHEELLSPLLRDMGASEETIDKILW